MEYNDRGAFLCEEEMQTAGAGDWGGYRRAPKDIRFAHER